MVYHCQVNQEKILDNYITDEGGYKILNSLIDLEQLSILDLSGKLLFILDNNFELLNVNTIKSFYPHIQHVYL